MPITDDVPLPPTFTMLSDLQSGTMEVCRADAVRAYGDARAAAAVREERERCAQICDDMVLYTGLDCAEAIRQSQT